MIPHILNYVLRNLYDHTQISWGRSMPREFGVPNSRRLKNLYQGLFNESVKLLSGHKLCHSVDPEMHTQFIRYSEQGIHLITINILLLTYQLICSQPVEDIPWLHSYFGHYSSTIYVKLILPRMSRNFFI